MGKFYIFYYQSRCINIIFNNYFPHGVWHLNRHLSHHCCCPSHSILSHHQVFPTNILDISNIVWTKKPNKVANNSHKLIKWYTIAIKIFKDNMINSYKSENKCNTKNSTLKKIDNNLISSKQLKSKNPSKTVKIPFIMYQC